MMLHSENELKFLHQESKSN